MTGDHLVEPRPRRAISPPAEYSLVCRHTPHLGGLRHQLNPKLNNPTLSPGGLSNGDSPKCSPDSVIRTNTDPAPMQVHTNKLPTRIHFTHRGFLRRTNVSTPSMRARNGHEERRPRSFITSPRVCGSSVGVQDARRRAGRSPPRATCGPKLVPNALSDSRRRLQKRMTALAGSIPGSRTISIALQQRYLGH
jgi:hypothetical protein